MAKGKNDLTGNDYLDQLHWQAQNRHRRWKFIRFEPKWKYKIVYRYPETPLLSRVLSFALLGTVLFVIAKSVISSMHTENALETITIGGIVTLIILILFFAIRDGSKDDDSKHIDS